MPLLSESMRPYNVANVNEKIKLRKAKGHIQTKEVKKVSNKIEVPNNIKTNKQFVEYVLSINVFNRIFIDLTKINDGEEFACLLKNNNIAWIERDVVGNYRYFTRTAKAQNAVAFTIIDFLVVLGDVEVDSRRAFLFARRELASLLQAEYEEYAWEKKQLDKYKKNFLCIHKHLSDQSKDNPIIDEQGLSHMRVFQMLNQVGLYYLSTRSSSIADEALFSCSIEELMRILKVDYKTLDKSINWLIKANFIRKYHIEDKRFPVKLKQKLQNEHVNNKTFFTIPLFAL